jgi:hypothetical protein
MAHMCETTFVVKTHIRVPEPYDQDEVILAKRLTPDGDPTEDSVAHRTWLMTYRQALVEAVTESALDYLEDVFKDREQDRQHPSEHFPPPEVEVLAVQVHSIQ